MFLFFFLVTRAPPQLQESGEAILLAGAWGQQGRSEGGRRWGLRRVLLPLISICPAHGASWIPRRFITHSGVASSWSPARRLRSHAAVFSPAHQEDTSEAKDHLIFLLRGRLSLIRVPSILSCMSLCEYFQATVRVIPKTHSFNLFCLFFFFPPVARPFFQSSLASRRSAGCRDCVFV